MDTMQSRRVRHFSIVLVVTLVWVLQSHTTFTARAQVSTRVASVEPSEVVWNTPLKVQARLLNPETIASAFLLYRTFAVNEWTKLEMDLAGNSASANVPAKDVQPPFIEYYLVLVDRAGTLETYPLSESTDPLTTPPGKTLQITVKVTEPSDQQVVFLSPEPFSTVPPEELLISVSLLRVDTVVDRRATRLFLDATEITSDAVFSGDIIVYSPENAALPIMPGAHTLTIRLLTYDGQVHGTSSVNFTIRAPGEVDRGLPSQFTYRAGVQLESRNERISDEDTWYNRVNLQFTGKKGNWQIVSRLFVTSDEKKDRQPQNRYFAGVESPWIKASYGDAFPSFPNLILSGKRVRGLSSALRLGIFNLDLTLGKTTRDIEGGLLKVIPVESLAVEQQRTPGAYDKIDDRTWGRYNYGTYARNLFAVRPSFGSGETWRFGFTWLKSKDDIGSIRYGTRPQENLVIGSDFSIRLDSGRIELDGQGAFSAFNSDIAGGTFTDAQIDSLFRDDEKKRSDARKVRDALQNIITVNENLTPLSFKKPSTIAYDVNLGLNYFDQSVRFTYLYRGTNYHSFGQTFLRNDIQGFNIVDRMRLLDNLAFVTIGYERLKDNTGKTKVATTIYSNFNIALGFSPQGGAQAFTVGYARAANSNRLPLGSSDAINDEMSRFFVQSTFDFETAARHTLSLNLSLSDRDDKTLRSSDVRNSTIGMGIATQYSIPLRTSLDVAINLNEFPAGPPGSSHELNYTSVSFNSRYSLAKEALILMATITPTFGDFKRTVIDLGSQWYVLPAMSFMLQFTHFNNRGLFNDTIWSLRYQYDV